MAMAAVLGACFLLYPGSRIRTWIFPISLLRIPAWIFLAVWFLYRLIEASFGLFSASANGGGVAFFARRRVRLRPGGDVAPGPGGTSRTPGARALHCAARGILPSPRRKTQDAGAEMRIGFVSGKIKIVISYQH